MVAITHRSFLAHNKALIACAAQLKINCPTENGAYLYTEELKKGDTREPHYSYGIFVAFIWIPIMQIRICQCVQPYLAAAQR